MQTGLMIAIAVLAGFAGAGLVWFSWSLTENLWAARAVRKKAKADAAPPPKAPDAKPEKAPAPEKPDKPKAGKPPQKRPGKK